MMDNVVLKACWKCRTPTRNRPEGKAAPDDIDAAARRGASSVMHGHDISRRRACRRVGVGPKNVRRDRPPERAIEGATGSSPMESADIRKEVQEIAGQRRRFGVQLERRFKAMNHNKLNRVYREEGLSVKRRCGRKRAYGTRTQMPVAGQPKARWSLDTRHGHPDQCLGPGLRRVSLHGQRQ